MRLKKKYDEYFYDLMKPFTLNYIHIGIHAYCMNQENKTKNKGIKFNECENLHGQSNHGNEAGEGMHPCVLL